MAGSDPSYHWLYWLVGVGLLTAVFSLYYYANIIKQMYFSSEASAVEVKPGFPGTAVVLIGVVGVVLFGLYAEPVLEFVADLPTVVGILPR